MKKAARHLFAAAGILLLAACGNTVSDAEYVERGQDLIDQGELRAAAIELKNALRQNPANPQARRLLGVLNFELGDMPGAEKELQRARELGVFDDSVLPLLARALLGQSRYEDLDVLPIHKLTTKSAKADVLSAQGLGKLARNQTAEAQKFINQAIQLATDSTYTGVARAQLLFNLKEYEAAREELNRVLGINKDYPLAWSLLGALQLSQRELKNAESSFTRAIQNRRANTPDLLRRALVRIQLKDLENAQKDVDLLLRRAPKQPDVHLAQGLIHLQMNRLEKAKEALERSLREDDREIQPKYYLALVNFRLGNLEQANEFGEQAFTAAPGSIPIRELLAAIKLGQREFAQAEQLVKPIVAAREDNAKALGLLADAFLGQGQFDQAVTQLERLLALQPDDATAELRLGTALLAAGRGDQGVAHMQKALEMDPGLELAHTALFRHFVNQNDFSRATQVAEDYRDSRPDSPEPWNLMGRLLIEQGDEAAAIEMFERALELAPGNISANHRLAALAIQSKDLDSARDRYQDVLGQHKDHLGTLMELAALDAAEKKESEMLAHLRRALAAHPTAVGPIVALARYHLKNGQPDKVATLLVGLNPADKKNPAVLEVVAYAQLAQNQYAEARFSLEELIKREPRVPQLHYLLALSHAGLQDVQAAEQELNKTLALSPGHLPAHLALGRLAHSQNLQEKALEHLAELERLAPENPDVLHLKAMLADAEGNRKEAADLLEAVFDKAPNTKTLLMLAQQKRVAGDVAGSLALQEQWVKAHPRDFASALALAGAYGREGEHDKAVVAYEELIAKDEENVVALNDLAWYLRDREPAKALEYAQRANDLAPESPLVLDTLAMVQLSNNQLERAGRSIERALKKAPDNATFRYHSAVIAEASGEKIEAEDILVTLLQSDAEFPERREAQELLRRLRKE